MAIPFQLPREGGEDLQDLDRLLSDLFAVLARILAQRGQAEPGGRLTIRRPQLRLQVTDEEVDFELTSSEDSASDSSAPPSPTSPTAPVAIPDLVSGLPAAAAPGAAPEQQVTAAVPPPARSRTRKPRSSPRKARSGHRGKKELTRTPSTRANTAC
ncbi:Synaptotagmin-C [Frankliniella fusca]|uniref:Synaptotagmin-C n=1 Tax=Frankliniella fusca TaxID=407009 RepID=A0AAE1LAM6_9NEOP|nr:Synaptotagmin-C [Frankliniella fusca]